MMCLFVLNSCQNISCVVYISQINTVRLSDYEAQCFNVFSRWLGLESSSATKISCCFDLQGHWSSSSLTSNWPQQVILELPQWCISCKLSLSKILKHHIHPSNFIHIFDVFLVATILFLLLLLWQGKKPKSGRNAEKRQYKKKTRTMTEWRTCNSAVLV